MQRPRERLSGKAPNIGVLLDCMGDQYQAAVLRGMQDAAHHAGANLRCFVGGQLPSTPVLRGRHRVYDLCSSRNVDGVVVLGNTLAHRVGNAALGRHCERYRPLPLVTIGVKLPGFPSVTVDNEVGMRGVLEHAIVDHGARRVAFVRGPLANAEAELRVSAYRATLAEHGLPFDERLVVAGTYMSDSGAAAVRALSEIPGLKLEEIDVIAASNDAMAMGVLAGLESQQLAVPAQMRVLGFDDIEDARLMHPPLTTVRQPLERMGQEALKLALAWLRDGAPPAERQLGTEPVIRRSCGCAHPSGRAGPSLGPERSLGFEAALLMKRDHIVLELARVTRGSFVAAGPDWAERLLSALVADLRNPEQGSFVAAFDTVLERLLARGVDLNLCDDVLGALRAKVVPVLRSDRARSERAEDLFHVCRLATSHAIQRGLLRERLRLGRWSRALNATCTALASSADGGELAARAVERLPELGIRSFGVVEYAATDESAAHVLCAYGSSGATLTPGPRFDRASLLPGGAADVAGSIVILPLVARARNLGHLLIELDLQQVAVYEGLADAIGVGLLAIASGPPRSSAR